MAKVSWRFEDPVLLETYIWPVNPNQDNGSGGITKSFAYESVSAYRRTDAGEDTIGTVIFEANVNQRTFSYSGFFYNQEDYDNMMEWAYKKYPLELWDDLGRGLLVYTQKVATKRVRSRQNIYKHSYTINGIILEEL
jgi:hypothetical protein